MKNKAIAHVTSFGHFAPVCPRDFHGYIKYHDSDKYRKMTDEELQELKETHRLQLCRNAAAVELALRSNEKWWNKNK
jgi:hypothetical protein